MIRRPIARPLTRLIAAALLLVGALLLLQACGGSDGAGDIREDPRLELYDDEFTTEGQTHVPPTADVPYVTVPPYGGPHDATPLACGLYSSPPRFENAVHAMEHGAVVIWYSPGQISDEQLSQLTELSAAQFEAGTYIILAPYVALGVPLMLVTWGERMPLESVERGIIEAYINEFKHDAPEPTAAGGCPTAS